MITPDKYLRHIERYPEIGRAIMDYPIAMFGEVVKYPKQAMIIKKWLEVQPKICVITGWKRTAKTSLGCFISTAWALDGIDPAWPGSRTMGISPELVNRANEFLKRRTPSEKVGLIGGRTMDHVDSVLLREYQGLIPHTLVKQWFSRNHQSVNLWNNTRWVVRSYDQNLESWKSGAYKLAHLDEEPPYEVLMEMLERTRTTKGKIIITVAVDDADTSYLPDACLNPLKYFGTDSFLHFKLGVEDVPDDIYPSEEKKIVFQQYDNTPFQAAVRNGEFAYVSGKWLPEFDPQIHVIKPFPIPRDWKLIRCVDAGTAAPTACTWVALHPRNIMFIFREYYKKGTSIRERCQDIIELSGNKRKRDGDIYIEEDSKEKYELTLLDHAEFKFDAVTGDSLDYEYIKEGLCVQPWTTLGQEARREIARKWLYVDKRERHFITGELGAPRVYVFDTCPNFIWEIQKKAFKKPTTERSGVPERKIDNKDDHLLDCFEAAAVELRWMVEGRDIV